MEIAGDIPIPPSISEDASNSICPICLGPVSGKAFLDPCYHCFCFQCILQWSEMVFAHPSLVGDTSLECPLCKTHCSCIIHNIVSDTFQRYYPFDCASSSRKQFSLSPSHYMRRYMYRHNLHGAMQDKVRQGLRINKQNIYISANKHVRPWVERELQALMHEADVFIIGQHVLGLLEHFEKQQHERVNDVSGTWKSSMVEMIRPFVHENTEMFVEELDNFLSSGLGVEAYDKLTEEIVQDHVLQKSDSVDASQNIIANSL